MADRVELLEQARRQRAATIATITAELGACECAFPIERMRNHSGHAHDCPAHAMWKERHGMWKERHGIK